MGGLFGAASDAAGDQKKEAQRQQQKANEEAASEQQKAERGTGARGKRAILIGDLTSGLKNTIGG